MVYIILCMHRKIEVTKNKFFNDAPIYGVNTLASSMRRRCTNMRGNIACKHYNAVVSKNYELKVPHYMGETKMLVKNTMQ